MRIASFNLENLTDARQAEIPLAARLEALRPQLQRLRADILCLQEVDAPRSANDARELSALAQLVEGTPYQDFHLANTTVAGSEHPADRHNLVILSRWPFGTIAQYANTLVQAPQFTSATSIPPASEPDALAWDRPILHATINLKPDASTPVKSLHIINLHLKAPLPSPVPGQKIGPFAWRSVPGWAEGYFRAAIRRSGQALEARILIDRIFDQDEHALIVLTGDFNAGEHEPPLRIVTGSPEDTGNGRLAPRSLALLEHSVPDSQRFTIIHRGRKQMLDHMLVSRTLLGYYRKIEIHNEMLGDELVAYTLIDSAPDSYHAPVVAEFDFPDG